MPNRKEYDVVIIGAGLTGLAAAYYLKQKGKDVLVLDKRDVAGGVIQTKYRDDFIFETGPNTGVLSNHETEELFDKLQRYCDLELAQPNVKKRLIWKNGKWHNLPMSPIGGLLTSLFTWKDKFGILLEPFRPKGTNLNESLADMIRRRMGDSYLDYAIDPFILGIFAGDPNKLCTRYAFPKLHALEQEHGSLLKGMIAKIFDGKQDKPRPSRKVFTARGGLSKFVGALAVEVGKDSILTKCENLHIDAIDSGFEIRGQHNGNAFLMDTPHIITTTSANTLPHLLPFLDKEQTESLVSLPYAPIVQVSLGFNKWEGMPLDAFGGLVPSKEGEGILGVLFMSSLFQKRAPKDGALLAVFAGGVRNPEILDKSDSDIVAHVADHVTRMLGIKHFSPDLVHVTRYNAAIAQYGADQGERLATIDAVEKQYPGLYIAGNIKGGIGMADRIKQAKELSQAIS